MLPFASQSLGNRYGEGMNVVVELVFIALILGGFSPLAAQVVISEFMASNRMGIADEDGDTSDWIEILNRGDVSVNLAGYGLTDSPESIRFQFPEVMLASGEHLVVFASGKDRRDPTLPLHAAFQLNRDGEYLALLDPAGEVLQAFDPTFPPQQPDQSYGLIAPDTGDAYAMLPEGTPGEANVSALPEIGDVHYAPMPASAEEPLVITARVHAHGNAIAAVRLLARVMFKNPSDRLMTDDGMAPDEVAGDGLYTASISNQSLFGPLFKPGEMVRWAVIVETNTGEQTRLPAFLQEDDEEFMGTVFDPGPIDTTLDIFHWFVEEPRLAETDGGTRSACWFRGEFYDNLFTRVRGGTARGWPKKSFKVEFPEDHHFAFDPQWPRVDEFNLNATYTDKSYARAILTTELHQASGAPSPITLPWRVHQNGAFYSVALFVEQPDRDFLRRNNLDPDGAYYKAGPGSTYKSTGPFEKKTRREEGKEDLEQLLEGLRLNDADLTTFLFDHVNLPAQVNFMAGIAITQNIDGSDKNHYLYRDTDGSGEWFMTPWDLDLSFGPDALNTDVILANEERRAGTVNPNATHPFIGSHRFPLHAGKTNELIDAIVVTSRTQDMLLRRIRTLHDTFLANNHFEERLDALLASIGPDAIVDNETWGTRAHFGGRRESMEETVGRIKEEYLADRRDFFERGGGVGIPEAQPSQPPIEILEVDVDPVSGNQDEEYLVLSNPNRFTVDLSGWRLEGAVRHTFHPGTVLSTASLFAPGRQHLYVVKDSRAFRARTEGPRGGERRFIQGDYDGNLSSRGEEIRLLNREGHLIASLRYEGSEETPDRALPLGKPAWMPTGDGWQLRYPVTGDGSYQFTLEQSGDLETWTLSTVHADLSQPGVLQFPIPQQARQLYLRVQVREELE